MITVRRKIMTLKDPSLRLAFFENINPDRLFNDIDNTYDALITQVAFKSAQGPLWWEGMKGQLKEDSRLIPAQELVGEYRWVNFYGDYGENDKINLEYVSLGHLLTTMYTATYDDGKKEYWEEVFYGPSSIHSAIVCPHCDGTIEVTLKICKRAEP